MRGGQEGEGKVSVVYSMVCDMCNSLLKFTCSLDHDGDLYIKVEPCEKCLDNAREEVQQEMAELG